VINSGPSTIAVGEREKYGGKDQEEKGEETKNQTDLFTCPLSVQMY
jgi:hypothetical protein